MSINNIKIVWLIHH